VDRIQLYAHVRGRQVGIKGQAHMISKIGVIIARGAARNSATSRAQMKIDAREINPPFAAAATRK